MDRGKGIGLGVFLLSLGVIILLFNFGVIDWSILNALWVLWPLILVVIGVSVIFHRQWIVRLAAWIVFLAVLVGYSYYHPDIGRLNQGGFTAASKSVSIEKPENIKDASLRLSMGACEIKLNSGAANLLDANIEDEHVKYTTDTSKTSDSAWASIEFRRDNRVEIVNQRNVVNSFTLNEDPVWKLNVQTGASNCNLDLSRLKVAELDYDGGASQLVAKFSDKHDYTKINIDAGAANIELEIPETAGIRVRTDKGLSSTNFEGPMWIGKNGTYQTENYEQAACKFDIDADIGLSNFEIKRIK